MQVSIADALFTATQQGVLGLLYGNPEKSFTVSELIALAERGSGAVQRELARLTASGLVCTTVEAGRKRYHANRDAPVFDELRALVEKTLGTTQILRGALSELAPKVRLALLYGSTAKGTATASSDIDVLLVSDQLTLEEVLGAVEPVERKLGRRVDPTIYTKEEFEKRLRTKNPFVAKVLSGDHVVLLGGIDEFATG